MFDYAIMVLGSKLSELKSIEMTGFDDKKAELRRAIAVLQTAKEIKINGKKGFWAFDDNAYK